MHLFTGCFPYELVIMNGLTVNLHLLMVNTAEIRQIRSGY